jgi:hypothetical protein
LTNPCISRPYNFPLLYIYIFLFLVPIPIQVMLEIIPWISPHIGPWTKYCANTLVRVTLFLYLRFFSNLPISTQLSSNFLYFFWLQKRCSHKNLLKGKGHGCGWLQICSKKIAFLQSKVGPLRMVNTFNSIFEHV